MIGVLIVLEALMISLIRGTPRVTFIEATPAKWNVFRVIWVPGSPIDCAPTAPTVEPIRGEYRLGHKGQIKHAWFHLSFDVFLPANRQERSHLFLRHFGLVVDGGDALS
jgi:hypothetical protein